MSLTLNDVFSKHFKHVKFDSKLAREVYNYQVGYINSNPEILSFYGSNLLGTHVVRFKDSDVIRFYDVVLDVDFEDLRTDLMSVKSINQDFKISSDTFNLTIMYVIHRFLTSPILTEDKRGRAAYDTALVFFYRSMAAILSDWFRYPADPKIAQAAYSKLNNKFLLKQLGSWHKVMDYRANALVDKGSIHYKKLVLFNDDLSVVYAINDSQGRIKDLLKNYYREFSKVHAEGESVGTRSSTYIDIEGEEVIKEKTKGVEGHVVYMRHVITDQHSFIRDDLVYIINNISSNSSTRTIRNVLLWLSNNYTDNKLHNDIDEFISTIVVHTYHLIQQEIRPTNMRDYPMILGRLKGLYLSSRSTDTELMRIRELGDKLLSMALHKKLNQGLVLSTRTSIILYISLRVLIGGSK